MRSEPRKKERSSWSARRPPPPLPKLHHAGIDRRQRRTRAALHGHDHARVTSPRHQAPRLRARPVSRHVLSAAPVPCLFVRPPCRGTSRRRAVAIPVLLLCRSPPPSRLLSHCRVAAAGPGRRHPPRAHASHASWVWNAQTSCTRAPLPRGDAVPPLSHCHDHAAGLVSQNPCTRSRARPLPASPRRGSRSDAPWLRWCQRLDRPRPCFFGMFAHARP